MILSGEGAAELLGQRRDDLAGVLRRDVVGGFVVLDGDQEIGVQITSGAQAEVAVVGAAPAQSAIGADAAGERLVAVRLRAEGGGQPPPVVCVGDDVAVAPVLVDRQQEDGDGAGAVVLQAVVGGQVELALEEGVGAVAGVDQIVEVGPFRYLLLLATAKLLQLPSSKARVSVMSLLRQSVRPAGSFSSRIQLWPA